jgi:predicted nuclease of predicted toxin-antitoxin system
MMRFAADENFNGRILRGLQARLPDLDIVRVQDTPMYAKPYSELSAWAAEQNLILFTHDAETIPGFVNNRLKQRLPMPGVIVVRETVAMGDILNDLESYIGAGSPSDFENLVMYVH